MVRAGVGGEGPRKNTRRGGVVNGTGHVVVAAILCAGGNRGTRGGCGGPWATCSATPSATTPRRGWLELAGSSDLAGTRQDLVHDELITVEGRPTAGYQCNQG